MRKTIIRLIHPIFRRYTQWYFSKTRTFTYKSIRAKILSGVFYPQFTLSTRIVLNYLETQDLRSKSILELGCGSGVISTLAAKKGAKVLASDINPIAIDNTVLNAQLNQVNLQVVKSDLFQDIHQKFNLIVINPPYFPKDPITVEDHAWYCGSNFEYFTTLFKQMPSYLLKEGKAILILSEDCQIHRIAKLAKNYLSWKNIATIKKWGEKHYLFELQLTEKPKAQPKLQKLKSI